MPNFSITHQQRLDDFLVVQTLEDTDIGIGQGITLSSMGALDGTYTVEAVPTFRFTGVDDEGDFTYDHSEIILNQLLVYSAGADIERGAVIPNGVLEWAPTCTWVVNADVVAWLGIEAATANDTAFITTSVDAANAYAYRRRSEAGYFDSLTTAPGNDALLGTIMYAGTLYRERGSVDSFASFEGMGPVAPFGSSGQINRLLGIPRSQVA